MTEGASGPSPRPPPLLDRARALAATGERRVLGITGAPGSGKSTLAAALSAALGPAVVVVPMDGFHLAQAELERLGRAGRKGAPDTFDAEGFAALLARVQAQRPGGETVYAPEFRREIEEAVAGAVPVEPHVPLVVVEGNYLLHDDGAWSQVADLLDECWYVEVPEEERLAGLVARHVAFGKDPEAARRWALGPDQRNAGLIGRSRSRADLVVGRSAS